MVHVLVLQQIVVLALLYDPRIDLILPPEIKVADLVHWELSLISKHSFKVDISFAYVETDSITKPHCVNHSFSKDLDCILARFLADSDRDCLFVNVL